jgi:maleylacetate reductase
MTSPPTDPYAGLPRRTIRVLPQERVVTGVPAADAVVAEIELVGAERVFVLTGRTLAGLDDGPVQRVVAARGARHAGTSTPIAAHSPREDVVAAAREARTAGADLVLAIGGGSVVDAGKAVLLCLWHGIDTPDAMAPYGSAVRRTSGSRCGRRATRSGS